jgi:toxin CptA
MSSPNFSTSLDLTLRPSVRAVLVLSALHIGAVALAVLAGPPKWAGLLMALLFLTSWFSLRRHPAFGYGSKALSRLIAHAEGGWTVETAGGQREDAELLGSSVVQSWIMVLNFRLKDGSRRSRAVVGDELDADALRRLRARLLSATTAA